MVGGEVALGVRGYVQVSAVHNHGSYSYYTRLSRVKAKKTVMKKAKKIEIFRICFFAFPII